MSDLDLGGVPSLKIDIDKSGPTLSHFAEWGAVQDEHDAFWNDQKGGYWVLTRYDSIRKAFLDFRTFSSQSNQPGNPKPDFRLLPTFLDPPEHTQVRKLLNSRFTPTAVNRVSDEARQICVDTIESFRSRGNCEFMTEFGDVYPTRVFLLATGLDVNDAPQFIYWTDKIMKGLGGGSVDLMKKCIFEIRDYFDAVVADRRENPRDPDADITAHLMNARIDGEPLSHDDLLWLLAVLVLAGLDTTKSQLGFNMYHLARHPEHRAAIVTNPGMIPSAVEELLRYYSFVPPGRVITEDIEFAGCPMKAGQMVMLPLWLASRDERAFERGGEVVLDRANNRHIAFGAGPHRCAGAHLARRELVIAMEEWHRLIPDYRLAADEPPMEHGHQLGLDTLHLTWDVV